MGMTLHVARNQEMEPRLSPRMRELIRMFGVKYESAVVSPVVELPILPGTIVLVTGPSGCGKTTLLRQVSEGDACRLAVEDATHENRAVIDCLNMPLCDALALLARCGLSEAGVLMRRPAELSQGQRYRFELARTLASPKSIIIADEFCSVLDRTVACIICWQMRKLIRQMNKTLIAATAHEDIAQDLEPDHWLQMDLGGKAAWTKGGKNVHHCRSHPD